MNTTLTPQKMRVINKITEPAIKHLAIMLAQLHDKHRLIAVSDRWLMSDPEDQDTPDLRAGQVLILESIDVDNYLFYPPFSHSDLAFITDNVDVNSDGINVYFWGTTTTDMKIGLRFDDVALPIMLPAELLTEHDK